MPHPQAARRRGVHNPSSAYTLSMRFYFIRHGETLANAAHIHQGREGGLSPKGRAQAERDGKALEGLGIRRIIASDYPRAKETATIIDAHLHVPVLYSPLFAERHNPSEIIGKSTEDPTVAHITDQIDRSYHADDYRFSDEENFADLKMRAKKSLALLERQSGGTTCVVTHHKFLKMLLASMLYRDRLHATDFAKLSFFNPSDNAGITVVDYHPWRIFSKTRWEILGYNEKVLRQVRDTITY